MQLKTLQIVWHGKEPVLSVDFQPNSHTLVSGGQDGEVKHWEVVSEEDGSPGVRFLSSYPVNSKAVNCVRFSPTGDMLASAGDKGEVLLWRFAAFAPGSQHHHQPQQRGGSEAGAEGTGPGGPASASAPSAGGLWRQVGLLRGHCDDVLDLAWAPDGSALLSGGIENNCILWDVEGRKSLKWLQDHGHYVQGVAWDPMGRYIASQSADRTARVYAVRPPAAGAEAGGVGGGGKRAASGAASAAAAALITSAALAREGFYAAATLSKGPLPVAAPIVAPLQQQQQGEGAPTPPPPAAPNGVGHTAGGAAKQPLFCDDSLPTFFRRLAWSPDGAFLAAPAGVFRAASAAPVTSTTHIFSRGDWTGPAVSLPCLSKGALVVRFCPRLFRLPPQQQQQSGPCGASRLPYRLLMAVASVDSVLIYDMQALEPLAVLGGIHFAAVTDLAWSDDGIYLVVASRDGYCTVCSFDEAELGQPVPLEELPPAVAAVISRAAARRFQEDRAAANNNKSMAAAAAAAAVAAAAGATPPLPSAVAAAAPVASEDGTAAAAPPPAQAGPRRIQPIAVSGGGSGAAGPALQPPSSSGAVLAAAAAVKRPAEGDWGPSEAPKPKRIQPIPLSATVLSAAVPSGTAAAATSSPGRRRIVPIRVDGVAGTTVPAGPLPTGLSPATLRAPSTASEGLMDGVAAARQMAAGAAAMATACTPLSGGAAGGGDAAGGGPPDSAMKMPTPQVLVFGTPQGSALRDGASTAGALSHQQQQQQQLPLAPAPSLTPTQQQPQQQPHHQQPAVQQQQQQPQQPQPKTKRLTPVPVERSSQQPLLGSGTITATAVLYAPPEHQPPSSLPHVPAPQLSNSQSHSGAPQPNRAAPQPPVQTDGTTAAPAVASAAAANASVATAAAAPAAAGSSTGMGAAVTGGGGGVQFSVAQLAAMRGAAAARKAADN